MTGANVIHRTGLERCIVSHSPTRAAGVLLLAGLIAAVLAMSGCGGGSSGASAGDATPATGGPAPRWNVMRLPVSRGSLGEPVIEGSVAAWPEGDAGDRAGVTLYDLDSERTTLVAAPDLLPYSLRLRGGLLAWLAVGEGHDLSDVVLFDPSTAVTTRIADTVPGELDTDGQSVVWSGYADAADVPPQSPNLLPRFTDDPVNRVEIFAYDVAHGEVRRLTTNTARDFRPRVAGGIVVWEHRDGGQSTILAHDLVAGTTWEIPGSSGGAEVALGDGRVAWVRSDGHDREVFVHDLGTGLTRQLSDDDLSEADPQLEGKWLLYRLGDGGPDHSYFSVLDLDGEDHVFDWFGSGGEVLPRLGGGWVAWHDESNGGSVTRAVDLEAYASGSRGAMVGLATSRFVADPPAVSRGRVIWRTTLWPLGTQAIILGAPMGDPAVTALPVELVDLPPDAAAAAAIRALADAGLVHGYDLAPTQAEFRPQNPLFRAQFAKLIVEALDLEVREDMRSPFQDLPPDPEDDLYPNQYVAAAFQAGIVWGTGPLTFEPWGRVSRAQVISMVVRGLTRFHPELLHQPPLDYPGTLGDFDPAHSGPARIAEYSGLLKGLEVFGPGWDPWRPATRAEAAVIVWNVVRLLGSATAPGMEGGS